MLPKHPRHRKQLHKAGDAENLMLGVEARRAFWKKAWELAHDDLSELLDVQPALEAVRQWRQLEEERPELRREFGRNFALIKHGPRLPYNFDKLEYFRDTLGPFNAWPVNYVDTWLKDRNLFSSELRADAITTLTRNLYVGSLDSPGHGPLLMPPEIPERVIVWSVPGDIAGEDQGLGDEVDWFFRAPTLLFAPEDIAELSSLMRDGNALRAAEHARLHHEVMRIFKRAVKRGTSQYLLPPEHHFEWFARERLLRQTPKMILEQSGDYTAEETSVRRGIRTVASLLGLPSRRRGRPKNIGAKYRVHS